LSLKVTIVDYGMGNIYSVINAIEFLGKNSILSSSANDILKADVIILPGVGSFGRAIKALKNSGLNEAISEFVLIKKRKILGICLGMQLLAESSEEGGFHDGLGFIKTSVNRFNEGINKKIPHIGFNEVAIPDEPNRLLSGIKNNSDFYFVHSYRLSDREIVGTKFLCNYGGEKFIAAYEHENIFATQFHPEKSQTNGLYLINNFLKA